MIAIPIKKFNIKLKQVFVQIEMPRIWDDRGTLVYTELLIS
jgi:hypothetical protein